MSIRTDLAFIGWDKISDANDERQAIANFQGMYNLAGAPLVQDGNAGPATQAALANSVARRKASLPDISANFSAKEFRCACGGKYADCERIWAERKLLQACEAYRNKLVGPMTIVRGCRCTKENKRVRGASRSQHLYGRAADIEIYDISLAQIKTLNIVTGVGLYDWGKKRVPRHIDVRPGNTPSNPATWDYGDAKSAPLRPRLDLIKTNIPAVPPKPQTPNPTTSPEPPAIDTSTEENELMGITVQHPRDPKQKWGIALTLWSIWKYILDIRDLAIESRNNTAATLALAKAQAQQAAPLTAEQTEKEVSDALAKFAAQTSPTDPQEG